MMDTVVLPSDRVKAYAIEAISLGIFMFVAGSVAEAIRHGRQSFQNRSRTGAARGGYRSTGTASTSPFRVASGRSIRPV